MKEEKEENNYVFANVNYMKEVFPEWSRENIEDYLDKQLNRIFELLNSTQFTNDIKEQYVQAVVKATAAHLIDWENDVHHVYDNVTLSVTNNFSFE